MGLTGFYRVQPKTDLLVDFSYGIKDFETPATGREPVHRRRRRPWRDHPPARLDAAGSATRPASPTREHGAYQRVSWRRRLRYSPTERTRITLVTERSVQESVVRHQRLRTWPTWSRFRPSTSSRPKLLVTGRVVRGLQRILREGAQGERLASTGATTGSTRASIGVEYQIQKWLASAPTTRTPAATPTSTTSTSRTTRRRQGDTVVLVVGSRMAHSASPPTWLTGCCVLWRWCGLHRAGVHDRSRRRAEDHRVGSRRPLQGLSGDAQDGRVPFPLIGGVQAAGLTTSESRRRDSRSAREGLPGQSAGDRGGQGLPLQEGARARARPRSPASST